jgi:hypothetical protein
MVFVLSDSSYDSEYLNALLAEWGDLTIANFSVHYTSPVVFVCGGPALQIETAYRNECLDILLIIIL